MNIRRIEAGILNAGSDFDHTTTPYDVGLGRFIDDDKGDFIGKAALATASRELRLFGVTCNGGEPLINTPVEVNARIVGKVTAGAISPFLRQGIGIIRLEKAGLADGDTVTVGCKDGSQQEAQLIEMPFYDKLAEIPRGKTVDVPTR